MIKFTRNVRAPGDKDKDYYKFELYLTNGEFILKNSKTGAEFPIQDSFALGRLVELLNAVDSIPTQIEIEEGDKDAGDNE